MLAAHGAPEVEHQLADLLGESVHLPDLGGVLQVDQWPDVETAGAGVRVEAPLGVAAGEDVLEPADELRQPGGLDRGVLDESDGFLVAGEAEKERERGLPDRPDVLLFRRVEDAEVGAAAVSEAAFEVGQLGNHFRPAVAGELDQDERPGLALDEVEAPRILERLAGEFHDHPVHEFDAGRTQFERHHPRLERREHPVEVQDRESDRGRQPVELHPGLHHGPERPLGADDQVRQVHPRGIEQHVQVVAGDPPGDAREPLPDVLRVLVPERQQLAEQRGKRTVPPRPAANVLPAQPAEALAAPVGQHDSGVEDVLHRLAVDERAGPGRVVADHAAEVRAVGGGGLGAEPQPVGGERGAEGVLHHPRLHPGPHLLPVDLEHVAEVHREVEHHRFADRLSGERGAAAARQHRRARLRGDPDRFRHVRGVAWDHHPERLDLVDAGVVRVEDPARAVEPHVPLDPRRECARQFSHGAWRVPGRSARSAGLQTRIAATRPRNSPGPCAPIAPTPR